MDLPWQVLAADIALALALLVSVITDLRSRLILNAVTFPALAIMLVCAFWVGGWPELLWSMVGTAVCAMPLLITAAINSKWMSWGDVKLMAVVGAAAGWPAALGVLAYVSVAGGVQALLWIVAARLRGHEPPKYVPYGVAITAGTLAAFLWGDRLF